MVVNSLYYDRDDAEDTVSFGGLIDDDVILKSLANIYNKDFHPDKEIEPEAFRAVWGKINEATKKGYGTPSPKDSDYDFYNQIQTNNAVFAAFKVHRAQNDMAALLTGDDGKLKPFKQWLNDVQPIASHQYGPWLRTEYDTAVIRAHQATDWQQFEREKDVLPNLEWMPSTSVHPGEDHMVFWGTIMPVDDPFWDEHRPGDRWNCKCSLQATDKEPTGVPEDIKPIDKPQPGLDNNPGKDANLFSDSHPYYPDSCDCCPFFKKVKNRIGKVFYNRAKDCASCPYIHNCMPDHGQQFDTKKVGNGSVSVSTLVNRDDNDYNDLFYTASSFAKMGKQVKLLPKMTRQSNFNYDCYYENLKGTKYYGKCPDMSVDGIFYELEGYETSNPKNAYRNMMSHGLLQSDRIIIKRPALSDRYMIRGIYARLKAGIDIEEVWIKENSGELILLYKKTDG